MPSCLARSRADFQEFDLSGPALGITILSIFSANGEKAVEQRSPTQDAAWAGRLFFDQLERVAAHFAEWKGGDGRLSSRSTGQISQAPSALLGGHNHLESMRSLSDDAPSCH